MMGPRYYVQIEEYGIVSTVLCWNLDELIDELSGLELMSWASIQDLGKVAHIKEMVSKFDLESSPGQPK